MEGSGRVRDAGELGEMALDSSLWNPSNRHRMALWIATIHKNPTPQHCVSTATDTGTF